MTTLLKVENLTKTYSGNKKPAVLGLDFSMKKGEVLSFVGASGSGKSTLLKMIRGLMSPDEGSIHFMGKLLDKPEDKLIAGEEGIKMVFQDLKLMPNHTVEENIKYPMLLLDKSYQEERTQELLDTCHLQEYRKRLPRELSGGQQQRLALARTLAEEPELLLIDEPFSNLDPIVKRELIIALREIIKKEGVSLIMVTHDTEDALMMSDKIGFLSSGELKQLDTPTNLYHRPQSLEIASFFGQVNIFTTVEFQSVFEEPIDINLLENQYIGIRAEVFSSVVLPNSVSVEGEVVQCLFLGSSYLVYLKLRSKVLVTFSTKILRSGEMAVFYADRKSLMVLD